MSRLLALSILTISALLTAGSLSAADETVLDVNMVSPLVRLPLYLPFTGLGVDMVIEGQVKQVSGPEAELVPSYVVPGRGYWVWARLPDKAGEYVFAQGEQKATVKVAADPAQPFVDRVTVEPAVAKDAPPQIIQRAVLLPGKGPFTQVSGPVSALMKDPAKAGENYAKIPDQVCTLVFQDAAGKRVVVRVWEDKDNRVFVSAKLGDDANAGTEDKPFKTIPHAVDQILKRDPKLNAYATEVKGDIYVAGGEYLLNKTLVFSYTVSLYGGYDENGWQRDPAITQSVLLPQGFRENWPNDLPDRHKDLRRADRKYRETIIRRAAESGKFGDTMDIGTSGSARLEVCGSPDTYIDGVTVFGADTTGGAGESSKILTMTGSNTRTLRNNILVMFWGAGHTFVVPTGGVGTRYENNIIQGGIVGTAGHARPQIVGSFGRWHRNLIMHATGGDYSRVLNLWGEAGLFTENQIHGGNSLGWSGMQAFHGGSRAKGVHTFRNNMMYFDYLFHPFVGSGLIMEGNDITLLKGGVQDRLYAIKALTIRNNTFRLGPDVAQENVFPTGELMTSKLGGKFEGPGGDTAPKLIEPQGEGLGKPVIGPNTFVKLDRDDRRNWNLVDLEQLKALLKAAGESEQACLRPRHPATNLKAEVAGSTVKLAWEASKDPEVVEYIVRYGPQPSSDLNPMIVRGTTTAEIKDLKPGRYYFTVAAAKEAHVECWRLSNEVEVTVRP